MHNEKICRGFVYLTVLCGHIPTLFPYFLVFHFPTSHYILMFLLLVYVIIFSRSRCIVVELQSNHATCFNFTTLVYRKHMKPERALRMIYIGDSLQIIICE